MIRILILSCVFCITGCGPQTPKTVQLSGSVTFKGELVPAGYIAFTPPAGKGSVRVVQIKNGRYNTAEMQGEKGLFPGHNIVRIAGFDGKVEKFYGQGKQIFNPHDDEFEVPEADGTNKFTVPEAAGKNVKIEPTSDE